jgi:hypothetical protein
MQKVTYVDFQGVILSRYKWGTNTKQKKEKITTKNGFE